MAFIISQKSFCIDKKFNTNKEFIKTALYSISNHPSKEGKPYIISCTFKINKINELISSLIKTHYVDYRKKPTRIEKNYTDKISDSMVVRTIEIVYKKTDKQNFNVIMKDPLKKYLKKSTINVKIPEYFHKKLFAQNN